MAITTITAEGLYSVTYQSTNFGNIATGFNLIMSGPAGKIKDKKTVQVSNGVESATFGSRDGVILREGTSVTRNYEGSSIVVVDPLYELFQKMVLFETPNATFSETVMSSGSLEVVKSFKMAELLFSTLAKGDIEEFLNGTVKPPAGMILYDKIDESPIIQALKGGKATGTLIFKNTFNHVGRTMTMGQMLSVGDIFTRIINPLGLELYWVEEGVYSLEPPRLSQQYPKPEASISLKEIVSLEMNSDPYNQPDVVIPSIVKSRGLGNVMVPGSFGANSLAAGILSKGVGGKNLKITTYDIPYFLFDPVESSMKGTINGENRVPSGIAQQTVREVGQKIAAFYGAHARKSSMYTQITGHCAMVFSPTINKPYSWYVIDNTLCFVSDIVHTINRGSASTVLTIAGVYTKDLSTNEEVVVVPSKVPEDEEKMISKLRGEADSKNKKIKKEIKEGAEPKKKEKEKMNKEEFDKIYGNAAKAQKALKGTPIADMIDLS